MKTLLLLLLLALPGSAQTMKELRWPTRKFGNQTVYLHPLYNWWQMVATNNTATNARPMKLWVFINGLPNETSIYGWTVHATIYDRPGEGRNEKIFLRHPPEPERLKYAAAAAKIKILAEEQQRAAARSSSLAAQAAPHYEAAKTLASVAEAEGGGFRNRHYLGSLDKANEGARFGRQSADASHQGSAAFLEAMEIRETINKLPSIAGVYALDAFAIRTDQTQMGLPVYDLGGIYFAP